jgi:hypothetical protein
MTDLLRFDNSIHQYSPLKVFTRAHAHSVQVLFSVKGTEPYKCFSDHIEGDPRHLVNNRLTGTLPIFLTSLGIPKYNFVEKGTNGFLKLPMVLHVDYQQSA